MAATIRVDFSTPGSPWRPPYTADTLFELPDADVRFEVLDGRLWISPLPVTAHSGHIERLLRAFWGSLRRDRWLLHGTVVRLPSGDGAIPDLLVTSAADLTVFPIGLPAALVHTVVEVESADSGVTDRVLKTGLYTEAGIPCYWRVEPASAIVVRLRDKDGGWQEVIAPAGTETELPVVVDANGTIVPVKIDPAALAG